MSTFYDYNYTDRLQEIESQLLVYKELTNSISDNRADYRIFGQSIGIDFLNLDSAIKNLASTLVIQCCTFSEQILKNFVYEILGIRNGYNDYIEPFVISKVGQTYVYDIKPNSIEAQLGVLCKNFEFLAPKGTTYIQAYSEIVKARHRFAHTGNYDFNESNFDYVIVTLKYFIIEYEFLLKDKASRMSLNTYFRDLKKAVSDLKKIYTNFINDEIKSHISNIINYSKSILQDYVSFLDKSITMSELKKLLVNFAAIDINTPNFDINIVFAFLDFFPSKKEC